MGLTLEMPTAEQLRSQFSKFGISDNSKVIYSANEWISPTTRVVFTLAVADNFTVDRFANASAPTFPVGAVRASVSLANNDRDVDRMLDSVRATSRAP
jgi:hypothetical protein